MGYHRFQSPDKGFSETPCADEASDAIIEPAPGWAHLIHQGSDMAIEAIELAAYRRVDIRYAGNRASVDLTTEVRPGSRGDLRIGPGAGRRPVAPGARTGHAPRAPIRGGFHRCSQRQAGCIRCRRSPSLTANAESRRHMPHNIAAQLTHRYAGSDWLPAGFRAHLRVHLSVRVVSCVHSGVPPAPRARRVGCADMMARGPTMMHSTQHWPT